MRNPDRLDAFYEHVRDIHKNYFPDWRFSQFISNFLCWYGKDPFYLEEGDFLEKLKEFTKEI